MSDQERLNENYYQWLCADAYQPIAVRDWEGVTRVLHDVPFYWTMWLDENRAGDALSFRQSDFLSFYDQTELQHMDQFWLGNWATAAPSVFEVLLGMARRWSFFYEQPANYYYALMFRNLGLHYYPGTHLPEKARDEIRQVLDNWMSRQFKPNGKGSPFPVTEALDVFDMRTLDIWGQMNAYSAEHFQ